MKKYIITLAIGFISIAGFSQSLWNITYNMASPVGETKDFADKMSFRGFGVDGRGFVNNNITIGGSWNWNVFYDRRDNAYLEKETAVIHGTQFRYVNTMPFMVNTHYYFGKDGGIRPFVGTGGGAMWKEEKLQIGTLSQTDNAWQFGLAPEIGAFIPLSSSFIVYVSAKYTHGFATDKLSKTSYINFGIGIGWESF